jgi:DNA-3-methyladenine glycosylase
MLLKGKKRLDRNFYRRDVLDVAPDLLGKHLVCNNNGIISEFPIEEVEAYRGEEDLACHASKGRTKRTEIMYHQGGYLYVYLIYGMYWMLNIVTGFENSPEAILIRGIKGNDGPGKLTRTLSIDGSFYGEDLCNSQRIWISDNQNKAAYSCTPRIGIDYAGQPWIDKPWRFVLNRS